MEFGKRLRELRDAAGLTQQELAEKTGLSQQAIAAWELGKREPGWTAVVALAKAFGVKTDAFAEMKPAAKKSRRK